MNEHKSHRRGRPSGTERVARSHGVLAWYGQLGYAVVACASLVWLGLRSGSRLSRIAYPCQRAAAANVLTYGAYAASAIASTRLYRSLRRRLTVRRLALLCVLPILMVLPCGKRVQMVTSGGSPVLPAWTSPEAISDVFAVYNVPIPTVSLEGGAVPPDTPAAAALSDRGVDALVDLMSAQGTHLHRTARHPDGLFGREDVVVIKVNAQWNCGTGADNRRAHTNADVVKGVIYRLVQHPEGFAGAVIVAENGQGVPARFDCADDNNAEDARQSYQDVVDAFAGQGLNVCTYLWDDIRSQPVLEYASADLEDGYVFLQDGEPGVNQLSYPKFEVNCGTQRYRLSMRYGLWDGSEYDDTRLKMINLPVLKRHGMAGATISVKNYIGFLTTADREARFGDFDDLHDFFWGYRGGSDYGLLGRQLALIRRADLNIVDAIWVNPVDGWHNEDAAVRDNILLASTDPFALDYYSSVYVLVPHMVPGSSWALDADARHHGGDLRGLLVTNENSARLEGMVDTVDLDDGFTAEEERAQFNAFVADASDQQDFALALVVEPDSRTVQRGESTAYRVSATIRGSFTRPVTLTLVGYPSETDVWFDVNPVIPPGGSDLYITTTVDAVVGTYPLTIVGSTASSTGTANLTLSIVDRPFNAYLPIVVGKSD